MSRKSKRQYLEAINDISSSIKEEQDMSFVRDAIITESMQ